MHIIRYNQWLSHTMEDPDLAAELSAIQNDTEAIRERFAIDLSFGTAGMRGIIGAGTNRMNIYTVRRATQGLANSLLKQKVSNPSVAISYDSRIKSELFARQTATVLAASGIKVYLYPMLNPVPCLSFAVRYLGTSAGIMITASHNPAQYNGYKVYGPDGCQMNTQSADDVLKEITQLSLFDDVKTCDFDTAVAAGQICYIGEDVLQQYYSQVLAQQVRPGLLQQTQLKVVYSPLNGSGNIPVRHVLAAAGLADVTIVPEQELPDGNFPTAPYPNPEVKEALALGLQLAQKNNADLMLATDPDADRMGIAVRDSVGQYHLMSGNQVGVLLLDYICKGRTEAGRMPQNAVMVRSVVSTPMADEVAKHYGVQPVQVLTGFKYIGEQIAQLEQAHQAERFIFGFEESYGYLSGTYVRDKDAVVASLLICEAAAYYKKQGITLYDAMQELYRTYGYYLSEVESFTFEGISGMEKMANLMAQLRKTPMTEIGSKKVLWVADYQAGTHTELASGKVEKLTLPATNMLVYTLEGGSLVTVRPSGTEPKVKVYYAVRETSQEKAQALHKALAAAMQPFMIA